MAQAGGIQNLNDSRDEVLQALLGSLTPVASSSSQDGPKLSAVQVKKLSKKLGELVGDLDSADLSRTRNEKGELVNEEGLPIIEVTEPLPEVETSASSEPTAISDGPDLIPLASLLASERERLRLERDRILDLLEQEENIQRTKSEGVVLVQRREALQKRKENAQSELEKLKAAREMQKKMGKALLRNMADAREKEEKVQREALLHDRTIEEQKKTLKPKKSVSFADLPPEGECESKDRTKLREKELKLDWGDVAPAKLRSANRSVLMTKAQMNRQPMKLDVVERLPTVRSEPEESIVPIQDSDDESVPPSPVSADSDEDAVVQSDLEDRPGSEDDGEDDLASEDDEFDVDAAQHHREIALAYYEKRSAIGEGTAKAMASHTHDEDEDEWDKPEVPLDATLSSPKPKPSMSRFKSDRNASSYDASSSISLGPTVLPSTGYQTLQRAIRTGRLEDDRLVGGEAGESASEPEDENVKEVLELLKMGEVHNVGPTSQSAARSSASGPSQPLPSPLPENIVRPSTPGAEATVEASASTFKPRASKFQLNRTSSSPRAAGPALPDSTIHTPVSTTEKSAPKVPAARAHGVDRLSSSRSSLASFPTINRSPVLSPSSTEISTIVDSQSFPQPTVAVSPSLPLPHERPFEADAMPTAPERRPERPPTVMSAAVLESTSNRKGGKASAEGEKGKKVSRFLAERM